MIFNGNEIIQEIIEDQTTSTFLYFIHLFSFNFNPDTISHDKSSKSQWNGFDLLQLEVYDKVATQFSPDILQSLICSCWLLIEQGYNAKVSVKLHFGSFKLSGRIFLQSLPKYFK